MTRRSLQAGLALVVVVSTATALSAGGKKVGELEPAGCKGCGPLTVYVSNQSYAHPRVALEVQIGGRRLVSGSFDVEGQHTWERFEFQARPGTPALVATAAGKAPASCTVALDLPRTAWVVISYWGKDGLQCQALAAPPSFL